MIQNKDQIIDKIKENDIKFIKLQFVDLLGELKNISITSGQIEKALNGKYSVDSFHLHGMHEIGCDRIYFRPDIRTFAILPWRPQHGKVARFLCDITDADGNEIAENPRKILRKIVRDAENDGYTFDIDPDCEFFLFAKDENGHVTTHTGEMAGYLDVSPLDKGENARRELILSLEEMGFEIESSRHELAPGQHSVIFKQMDGVRLADQIMTFRTTIRTVAERYGLHATFMPKPRTDLPGSAMRLSISVYKDGRNLFRQDEQAALHFIAGILEHQPAISAFSNPLVNSYKRLLGGTQAPSRLYWSRHDHYAPLRLALTEEGCPCIQWTLPDGAANPYLTLACAIGAGLEGIRKGALPPVEDTDRKALPATLLEALNSLENDAFLRNVCGESYANVYVKEKKKEWERYSREVTDWELKEYLRRV